MPLTYRIITAVLALMGCLSLVVTGELLPVFMLPGLALVPGYFRFLRGGEPGPRWVIGTLSIAAVGLVAFDTLYVTGDFFIAVAHMTIVFQALKSFDLREPWDNLQVYFMSLLQLIIASELAISMAVGGMFTLFLFAFVAAIIIAHFASEGSLGRVGLWRPVAVVSLVAFMLTGVFFAAVPRAQGNIWSRKSSSGIRSVGFSGTVDFGAFGDALEDPSIVMRVKTEGTAMPLYWRGLTFDNFDGTRWTDTIKAKRPIYRRGGRFNTGSGSVEAPGTTVQRVYLEPLDTPVVFGLGEVLAVEAASRLMLIDRAGSLYLPAKQDRRFTYTAYSRPLGQMPYQSSAGRYLQFPSGSMGAEMAEITELAREIAGAPDVDGPLGAARAIEQHLKGFDYSLETSPPPPGVSAISDFLFSTRSGYCEHFATSMVLMLRGLGIPARIVTGFVGGESNAEGDYFIIRQRNAHSWVEAAIDGRWRRFDPTPTVVSGPSSAVALAMERLSMLWYMYVIGYDSFDQREALRTFASAFTGGPGKAGTITAIRVALALIIFIALAAYIGIKAVPAIRARRGLKPESRAFIALRAGLIRRGGRLGPSSTASEVLAEAARHYGDTTQLARGLALYEGARFGGRDLDAGQRRFFKSLASSLR